MNYDTEDTCNLEELQKLKQELQIYKGFYNTIENLQIGVIYISIETSRIKYINKFACAKLGYEPQELTGISFFDLCRNENIETLINHFKELPGRKYISISTFDLQRKDKSLISFKLRIKYEEYNGEPSVVIQLLQLFNKTKIEKALHESEIKFKILFNIIGDAIYIHNQEGNILEINQVACSKLGYTRNELLEMTVNEIDANPDDIPLNLAGTNLNVSIRVSEHIQSNGNRFPVEINSSVFNYFGTPALLNIARDITAWKNSEKLLKSKLDFIQFILTISSEFINIDAYEIDEHINKALEFVTKFAIVERGYLFMISEDRNYLELSYEWCMPGVKPHKGTLERIEIKSLKHFAASFQNGDYIKIKTSQLSKDVENESIINILQLLNVKTLINLPLSVGGKIIGYIGFDSTEFETDWDLDIINAFKLTGQILANAIIRKKTITILKEREVNLNEAQRIGLIGSWVIEHNTGKMLWSEQLYRIFGYSQSCNVPVNEIVKKHIHPDDLALYNEKLANLQNWLIIKHPVFEFRVIAPDGNTKYCISRSEIIKDKKNNIINIKGTIQDISERKTFEIELLKLQTAVEQSANTIVITNTKGDIEYVNRKFTEITGYHYDESIGRNPKILKSGFQNENFYKNLWSIISSGKEWFGEFCNRDKNGKLYWESATITPVKDKNGNIINYIAIKEDITKKREVEIALRQSESRLRSLFENASTGIAFGDKKGNFLNINDAFCNITGYSKNKLYRINFQLITYSDDIDKELLLFRELIDNKQDKYRIEKRFVRNDKSLIWVDVFVSIIRDEKNEPLFFVTIANDISSKKQTEEQLIKAKIDAEKANLAKSVFLANMSHEIRTPMNSIIGFADLLYGQIQDPVYKNYISSIKSSGRTLLTLINDILDLSKIEAGRMQIQPVPLKIREIVNEIINVFSISISRKNLILLTEIDDSLPDVVYLDDLRLRQILLNILGNAVKFTEKGSISIFVRSRSVDDKLNIEISIDDTGIGIPQNEHQRIFEAFGQHQQLDTRKFGGTGLGLSITKKLVEMMGGQISVESRENVGSKFSVVFYNVLTEAYITDNEEINLDIGKIEFEKSLVILLSNIEVEINLIKNVLKTVKIDVINIQEVNEIVSKTLNYQPQIIIIDLNILTVSNFHYIKQLTNNEKTQDIHIIGLKDVSKQYDTEISGFFNVIVEKPIKFNFLAKEISKYIAYIYKLQKPVIQEDNLDTEVKVKVEVLRVLKNEFLPIWEKVSKSPDFVEIEEFANHIEMFGTEMEVEMLIDYGQQLYKYTNNMEIENMESTLKSFPQLIKELGIND